MQGRRSNSLLMGTHVVSGSASAVVARIGRETEYGGVSEPLKLRPPETEFERGFVVSATLIVLVVRSRVSLFSQFRGRGPSKYLLGAILLVIACTLVLPYTPVSGILGFTALPPYYLAVLAGIVILYVAAAEWLKRLLLDVSKERHHEGSLPKRPP